MHLPKLFRDASLALGQSYDCPSASEVTLKYMGQIGRYLTTTKHKRCKPYVWIASDANENHLPHKNFAPICMCDYVC